MRILTPVPANNTQRRASHQVESGNNSVAINSENVMDEQKVHIRSASDDIPLHVIERMRSKEEGDEVNEDMAIVPIMNPIVYTE